MTKNSDRKVEKMTENADKVKAVREYIAHVNGTENWYKNPIGLIYTDGVRVVAEACGAYWLIDVIASHQCKIRVRREMFQLWTLSGEGTEEKPWVVECHTDCAPHGHLITRQEIPYTDFPAELMPMTMWVENGTILLPCEH